MSGEEKLGFTFRTGSGSDDCSIGSAGSGSDDCSLGSAGSGSDDCSSGTAGSGILLWHREVHERIDMTLKSSLRGELPLASVASSNTKEP